MKSVLLIVSLVLFIFGCAQEKTPSNVAMTKEKSAALEKANIINEVPTEPEMKEGKLVPPFSVSRESIEDIISSGSWGFSVYSPKEETIDYYTSAGRFLGRVSR